MDIWIRSQDRKKIINCKMIIYQAYSKSIEGDAVGQWWHLGKYSSEERAIEILDEICESFLLGETKTVYYMPEK
jgi:hypothetical protein